MVGFHPTMQGCDKGSFINLIVIEGLVMYTKSTKKTSFESVFTSLTNMYIKSIEKNLM